MISKKLALASATALSVAAVAAPSAQAIQTNNQSAFTFQGISQSSGGFVHIGPTVQVAGNGSFTQLNNFQFQACGFFC